MVTFILIYQSGPGSDGNEGVLHIPQSSSTAGTTPSDCLMSYAGHLLCFYKDRKYVNKTEKRQIHGTQQKSWVNLTTGRDMDLLTRKRNHFNIVCNHQMYVHTSWPIFKSLFLLSLTCIHSSSPYNLTIYCPQGTTPFSIPQGE